MSKSKPRRLALSFLLVIPVLIIPILVHIHSQDGLLEQSSPATLFPFDPAIKKLFINIGPNISPVRPPDSETAVIAIEANVAIANHLRETFQKDPELVNRFYVINCAIAGAPLANSFSVFHHYNKRGMSSSLSTIKTPEGNLPRYANRSVHDPSENFGPGPGGFDFVPVLSLDAVLDGVPREVQIDFLKTDTQGFDLQVIKSASRGNLRRLRKIKSETYLPQAEQTRYEGATNDLYRDWVPYMKKMGFRLTNPTDKTNMEYDAIWERIDE